MNDIDPRWPMSAVAHILLLKRPAGAFRIAGVKCRLSTISGAPTLAVRAGAKEHLVPLRSLRDTMESFQAYTARLKEK